MFSGGKDESLRSIRLGSGEMFNGKVREYPGSRIIKQKNSSDAVE